MLATGPNSWIWWPWVTSHGHLIWKDTRQHIELTAVAVAIGLVISLPLALVARRYPRSEAFILGGTGVVYTIPSLAAIGLLLPITGLSALTAEIMLVGYTLLILVRNVLAGLEAVPDEIREAARGMGFGPMRLLVRIELPLALPAIIAGIRIATVTTIGLVTITALIGLGGLGQLIYDGLGREFHTPLIVGSVLSVVLAVIADVALLGVERIATPWARARRS
ncbi:MAG: ABC transporter permease [Actinobacteria bacterium]|nr:ABC transporter permease [Actinomycetota bacterium]MBV8960285.1 ABC transporter permease [Actinomycetota bacterium]MBV9255502.1 ABC transporter permease [Actinomycetota bacterium]MBV9664416.1 ABC transporter permease [Actinomycetota bacterium]MBV9933219.1 ABC transporter permease [Actinomycetota bacterium]